MEIKFTRHILALVAVVFVALMIRMNLLGLHRMHMDECLYSSYAVRMVTHGDIGMNGGLRVDKPPVMFYILALSFLINGVTENAARIPGIIMSLVLICYAYILARKIFKDDYAALFASAFCGLSVYVSAFSATAFQDMPMALFFIMSIVYAYDKRPFPSAVFYWLSVMSKPMTLFLGPVYLVFIIMYAGGLNGIKKDAFKYIKGSAVVIIPVFVWSALLANPRFGMFMFFVTQQPEAMGISFSFTGRLLNWFSMSGALLNSYYFLIIAPLLSVSAAVISALNRDNESLKAGLFVSLTAVYCYLVFFVLKFRQFDRYLLIIQPFLAFMLAWGFAAVMSYIKKRAFKAILAAFIVAAFSLPALHIQSSGFEGGALFKGSDGFDKAAAWLKQYESPENEIRYLGGTLSWYGYFYLAESKYASALPYYSSASILQKKSGGRAFIVIDTAQTSAEDINAIALSCRKAYSVSGSCGELLIYEM